MSEHWQNIEEAANEAVRQVRADLTPPEPERPAVGRCDRHGRILLHGGPCKECRSEPPERVTLCGVFHDCEAAGCATPERPAGALGAGEQLRAWGDLIQHQWGHVPGACGLCDGWLALQQAEARAATAEGDGRALWRQHEQVRASMAECADTVTRLEGKLRIEREYQETLQRDLADAQRRVLAYVTQVSQLTGALKARGAALEELAQAVVAWAHAQIGSGISAVNAGHMVGLARAALAPQASGNAP